MRLCVQDYTSESDETLAKYAQQGDDGATEALLLRYKNAVRARARQFFLAGGETDDLVQEGMVGLYLAVRDYDPNSGKSFKNFAYLCVTRRIFDALRSSFRKKSGPLNESVPLDDLSLTGGENPEEFVIDSETRAEFRVRLMRELSDFEFRIMTMYLEGMSYAQICEATGKDFKSVDNALSRSKKKLQKAYREK